MCKALCTFIANSANNIVLVVHGEFGYEPFVELFMFITETHGYIYHLVAIVLYK